MKKKNWKMPKWMEQYRPFISDGGLGVEEMMNDTTNVQVNAYVAMVSVQVAGQVQLLTRLHNEGKA